MATLSSLCAHMQEDTHARVGEKAGRRAHMHTHP